ncbi:hypothetical protein FB451DRAFT_1497610 [Mycena latifolia]|nr:hypothetical protein FB451DRAFT_1497610 [Mycena latifolia]
MSVPAEPGAGPSPQPRLTPNSLSLTDADPLPTPLTDAHPQVPASLTDPHPLPASSTDADPLPLPPLTRRVKITPWRLLNTVLVLGLGIYKAAASYLGQSIAPTTLDWIIGVVWTLTCYWVSFAEQENSAWFFAYDLTGVLRVTVLGFFIWFLVVLVVTIPTTGFIVAYIAMCEVVSESTVIVLVLCGIGVLITPLLASIRGRRIIFSASTLGMFVTMIVVFVLWLPCAIALGDWMEKLDDQLELLGYPKWLKIFIILAMYAGSMTIWCIGWLFAYGVAYRLARRWGHVLSRRTRQNSLDSNTIQMRPLDDHSTSL